VGKRKVQKKDKAQDSTKEQGSGKDRLRRLDGRARRTGEEKKISYLK